jgi:cyclophilin family peptidyl-prolyl cis-trans isomerase
VLKKSIHNLRRGLNANVNLYFMFPRLLWFFCAASLVFNPTLRAQMATVPTQFGSAPATTLSPGETQTVDLRTLLGVPGITGQVMQFETVRGTFNAELLANDAPKTVANFLNYVNRGAYTNSIIHRSVPGFVIQGGGFTAAGNLVTAITADPPVQNEFKVSNTRGTIAMAKTAAGPNTATNQWFVNLGSNSANLDNQNGGFTVFARVLGNGMTVADSIAAITAYDVSGQLGADFTALPLIGGNLNAAALVVIRAITAIPVYPSVAGEKAVVTYTATSSNAGVATGTVNGSTLTLTGLSPGTANITVRAADVNNSAAQVVFAVTVAATAPVITAQPLSAVVASGQLLALNVAATGSGLTYQWKRVVSGASGTVVSGATGPQFIVDKVTSAEAGIYYCTVTNSAGAVDSAGAIIAVRSSGEARLTNLAVRAALDAGQVLIVGFSTTGKTDLLVRGVGPKLADFGVTDFYADPRLEIYDGAGVKGLTNDSWDGALATTFQSVGAFALNLGSKDAALVTSVNGASTAQLKGTDSGVTLLEVYALGGLTAPARLNNVSTLNRVGTGGNILIAGFTVSGDVAKTLLIRGVGPKLTSFGVGGVLADPKLEIYRDTTLLAANDDWNASVAAATPGLGFALDAGSKDAGLLVTLPPGGYTAQLSGVGATTGVGLIEVYEVP